MGRIYSVEFTGVAVTVAVDHFEVAPVAGKPIAIHGLMLSQSSDLGDAAEEILRVQIIRGHATSGSSGATPTPARMSPLDTVAGFTAETNNTTIASTGTPINLLSINWNIRAGLEFWFPPECRPMCTSTQSRIVVRLLAAPADSLTMAGTLFVEELI